MGCCMSSPAKHDSPYLKPQIGLPQDYYSPPKQKQLQLQLTASVEEETVKEVVLSEKPISKPPTPSHPPAKQTTPITHQKKTQRPNPQEKTPEISQVSGTCSTTDTISISTTTTATTATTTVTEIRDDEVTSKKRVPRKRHHTAKSPAKIERAPLRRDLSNQVKRNPQRNVGPSGGGMRRERSPAPRTSGGTGRGRTVGSPAKQTGKSGGRTMGVGCGVKEEEGKSGSVKQQELQQGNESLENPLVSLECFIFL